MTPRKQNDLRALRNLISNAHDLLSTTTLPDARFTRLSNAFSKKLDNLKAAGALHFAYYNFCSVHQTLRVTPAMQAGITDHVWTIGEILA